jgi:hypothetical protein
MLHLIAHQGKLYVALYAIRNAKGEYRIGEVDGPAAASKPALVSTGAYAISPFSEG